MAQAQVEKKPEFGVSEAVQALVRKDVVKLEGASFVGRDVEVRICKVRDIPDFLNLVSKLWVDLGLTLDNVAEIEATVAAKLNDGGLLLKLISNNWDEVVNVLSKLSNLKKEEVEELDLDDAVLLVKRAVEINYTFFIRKVLPLLPGVIAEKLAEEARSPATT